MNIGLNITTPNQQAVLPEGANAPVGKASRDFDADCALSVTESRAEVVTDGSRVDDAVEGSLRRDDDLGKLMSQVLDFAPPAMPNLMETG